MLDAIRPAVRAMTGYVPGEQPRDGEYVKLNTNECPYPPSPRVFDALRDALTGDRLRKYPDPSGRAFRVAVARLLNVDPDGVLIGNGSDDCLTILTRSFVPEGGVLASPTPSYVLYRNLAEIQGAAFRTAPFAAGWALPAPWPLPDAHLTFVANPNSPSGTAVGLDALRRLKAELRGPLVVDEAYIDFADAPSAVALVRDGVPGVVVTRTLSKSYSLAGVRFGYAVAEPALVRELLKVKDSYNCDALSLAAATAAVEDQEYLSEVRTKVLATRGKLAAGLAALGFDVTPSQANFVWARRGDRPVKPIYEALKERKVLVRYMDYGPHGDGLRVSVGTDTEVGRLLDELGRFV